MAARTLTARAALLGLFNHVGYTLERLKAHALGAPHLTLFETIRTEGLQILTQELQIAHAQVGAQAQIDIADDQLDDFASRLSKEVLTLTDDNREHSLYLHFFRKKTLSEFKRPVLRAQLASMRGWIQSLTESEHPSLRALAPELTALIQEADAAVTARDSARQTNRIFRDTGDRSQWVDRLNAARKETHGALSKLPHERIGLPTDFADRFFYRGPKREDHEEEEETVESMQEHIEALREQLEAAEARLAELEAAEAEARKVAETHAAHVARLADIERAAAALEKERAAVRKQIAATAST
ncbi:hypothetical protein [Chondromyces crocatus]|uniref:Uncharacterized protein n=1 Tax=Chondromyces crocatus TaxID=52 RepID=A0A0K1EFV7_CHOCO|nr:hypothetical protein [Chondromyces crocatus]AKT39468.1 uncharacterized protein CMC5_036150 [Chondromyces crocatus]